jgi:hypothetical protein
LGVKELLRIALEHPDACYDPEKHQPIAVLVDHYVNKLASKAEMLEDFFALKFSRGDEESKEQELVLEALPIIIDGIQPFAQELPMFILRLAAEVDFSNE